jgi:L-ascorbate metabolism protein UlaG (beta-lactamase superfamily)
MIRPIQSGDALLSDVRRAASEPGFHLWWFGQSGFLVQHRGRHLLIDPYLSDSLTKKYARTDKPHVRMTELAIGLIVWTSLTSPPPATTTPITWMPKHWARCCAPIRG